VNDDIIQSQPRDTQQWYRAEYSDLLDLAARHLMLDDAEKVLASLAAQLHSCAATTQIEFQQWASESVTRAAKLMATFRDLYTEHQALVYDAINKGLGPVYRRDSDFCRTVDGETGFLMTANETAQEIAAETWTDVLKKLGKWKPGKAKITTWIYRIAYLKALNHKKLRTRRSKKESFLTLDDLAAQEQESLTRCE
jgi:DNA-directed RNA polymerase specialized sigma24 family protein